MTARSLSDDTIDALANDPGRSSPAGLGTSASNHQRAARLVDGGAESRDAARIGGRVAFHGDLDFLVHPHGLRVAFRHGHSQAQRMDPDDRHGRRSSGQVLALGHVTLADDAVERGCEGGVAHGLTGKFQFGAPLFEHRLPVPHFLEGVLVAALGDLQRGVGRVERRFRRDAALEKRRGALPREPRFAELGLGRSHDRRLLGIDQVVVALDGQAQTRARLLQRRLGLVFAQVEIGGRQTRQHLATGYAAAQIDVQVFQPAGDFQAERHLLLCRQRAGDADRADEPILGRGDDLHFARVGRRASASARVA